MTTSSTSTTGRRFAMAIVAGALALGISACGTASDKIAEKSLEAATGGNVDVDSDGNGLSIKTEDGEFSTKATNKLPDGWPSAIMPLPDGFTVQAANTMKTGDGAAQTVSAVGVGDPEKIIQDYADAFEKNGVEVVNQSTGMYNGVNGTKDHVTYSVTVFGDEDDGETTITLSVVDTPDSDR